MNERTTRIAWLTDLWEVNWKEGNSLFAYMTMALLPEYRAPSPPGRPRPATDPVPHAEEGLRRAKATLVGYPVDRILRPVMNTLRDDIERNPHARRPQSAEPLPIAERPLDNEYIWKGNPYQLDGWLKPTVTMFQLAFDDRLVAWFTDSGGRLFMTLDGGKEWRNMNEGLMGAGVRNIVASKKRTFVLWARTDTGVFITRDGGMSWRPAAEGDRPTFEERDFREWLEVSDELSVRINEKNELVSSGDGGTTASPCMIGWRIPRAHSVFSMPRGIIASGPGGCYESRDARSWTELKLWREDETGSADFLHAYWMGRYYGFIGKDE